MSTYLVVKRMQEDRVYMPGETLTDPDLNVGILMERGYLTPVPNDYTAPTQAKNVASAKGISPEDENENDPPRRPTVEEGLEAGYSQQAAEDMANGVASALVDEETEALEAKADEEDENDPDAPKRPEAQRVADALGSTLDEVNELSDEDYRKVVSELPPVEN